MPIKNRIAEMQDEIAAWRRDFHEHPELLYDTNRTAAIVAAKLREFGCDEVAEGIGRTGVVGLIRGRSDLNGRVVGIRADMDALPILEATGLPYASKTPGKMHACGHDGHTAMLLGAAKYLAETRNFDGAAAVIFQPAEEGGAGGKAMVEDGLIERFGIREIYGMHNSPGHPVGAFAIRSGPFYAATDTFTITVIGRGGHAARPHTTVDPTLTACHLVLALQSIASRNADPVHSIVVSVTSFRTASDAYNVIPETVELRGTVRTFDPELRARAEARVKAIAAHTAEAFGGRADVDLGAGLSLDGQSRGRDRFRHRGGAPRLGERRPSCAAAHGRRGLRLYAAGLPGRLYPDRRRRGPGSSSPRLQFQRRRDSGRRILLGRAHRAAPARWVGGAVFNRGEKGAPAP